MPIFVRLAGSKSLLTLTTIIIKNIKCVHKTKTRYGSIASFALALKPFDKRTSAEQVLLGDFCVSDRNIVFRIRFFGHSSTTFPEQGKFIDFALWF